jgi:hypothetical protein
MAATSRELSVTAKVELLHNDLIIIQNALNEVLNGLDQTEFETRLGSSRHQVLELHDHINQVAKRLITGEAARHASTRR